MRPSKLRWLMEIANVTASRSEDPHVKVGAVAVRQDYTVIGHGYNGVPPDVELDAPTWADRDARRPFIVHAEINAIRYARPGEVWSIVTTHIPCEHCMNVLGSYAISVVVYENTLGDAYDDSIIRRIANLNRIRLIDIQEEQ